MEKRINFKQLCREAGFYHPQNVLDVDKKRLCAFLFCSIRSLNRWVNEQSPPCPRAVAMLKQASEYKPDAFKELNFTRDGEMSFKGWRRALPAETVKRLPDLLAQLHQANARIESLNHYIDTLTAKGLHERYAAKLKGLSHALNELSNDALRVNKSG
jgi:hypothetical protein